MSLGNGIDFELRHLLGLFFSFRGFFRHIFFRTFRALFAQMRENIEYIPKQALSHEFQKKYLRKNSKPVANWYFTLYRTSGVLFFIDYCTALRDT
jgi:hypothetical protein